MKNVSKETREHVRYAGLQNDMVCGVGPCTFSFMQVCGKISVFTGIYSVSALVTSVLSTYMTTQITTIEKQFGLSSSQSGFLLSCNDLGFLMTTLFASYFARIVHIPRMLFAAVIMYGLGSFICAVPYFVSKDLAMEQGQNLIEMVTNEKGSDNSTIVVPRSGQPPLCNVMVRSSDKGYYLPEKHDADCSKDGAVEDFGIGEPNKYTKFAIAFIAIGKISISKFPRFDSLPIMFE